MCVRTNVNKVTSSSGPRSSGHKYIHFLKMQRPFKLLVEHAHQVVQVTSTGQRFLAGRNMQELAVLQGAKGGYSVLIGHDGLIVDVDTSDAISAKYDKTSADEIIDASGHCLLPGFVDAHTHPVWAGDRVHEFAMKLAGATYMDIHKMGGGIHFTVKHTREADESKLFASLQDRLVEMACSGTTLVECKSGYGLDLENEVKMLRVIEMARKSVRMDISSTYCGAHAIPPGKTAQEATDDVIKQQIPHIQQLMALGELHVNNIDVFCEEGVFDISQSREILKAGKDIGLQINFHGEELHRLNSAEMGAELQAHAISHLEEISESGIQAMAKAGSVAVALPTTAYNLRLRPPPVRKMIDAGVIVCLGSDFNPNAHCMAMPVVMNLACVTMNMSMPEALVAATLNAAHALGRSGTHGSLEVGKVGNMILLQAPSWEHIIYQMGSHNRLISHVIWKGQAVYQRPSQI
ncbi:putative imidazolonepropionase [Bulinus truncatus]|nr:putative imidazolonepropionase [Bulinus truncatus]